MNPSGFYVDPCFPPEKEHGGASRAGPGKRRSQPHVDVNSHVDAKKSLRNFFKSGGFNQKRQLPTLPL